VSPSDCRLPIVDCQFKSKIENRKSKILIVGVGNPLLGDEGIGPYAVRNLSQLPMPRDVDLLDCGCDLLNLVSYLPDPASPGMTEQAGIDKPKKIVVLDAIRAGGKPGRIYRFDLDELETIQTTTRSAHQLQTIDALRLLKKVCPCLSRCEIIVIGIEPKVMELSGDLSEEVMESIADLTRLVLEEL
jgi:hydrogenase maturation protease